MIKALKKMAKSPLKTLDKVSNIGLGAANRELDKAAQEAAKPRGKSSFVDSQTASIAKAGRKMIDEDMKRKGITNNMASNMANTAVDKGVKMANQAKEEFITKRAGKLVGRAKTMVSDKLKEARGAASQAIGAGKAVDKVLRKKMGGAAKTCSRNYTSKKRTLHSLY